MLIRYPPMPLLCFLTPMVRQSAPLMHCSTNSSEPLVPQRLQGVSKQETIRVESHIKCPRLHASTLNSNNRKLHKLYLYMGTHLTCHPEEASALWLLDRIHHRLFKINKNEWLLTNKTLSIQLFNLMVYQQPTIICLPSIWKENWILCKIAN